MTRSLHSIFVISLAVFFFLLCAYGTSDVLAQSSERPPQIVAEAGILPGHPLRVLDQCDEWMERTIFSYGIPGLRVRILLAQAAERIAELQALERLGELTPSATEQLLERHQALLATASDILSRRQASGHDISSLLLAMLRTRVASAEVLSERAADLRILDSDVPVPETTEDDIERMETLQSLATLLDVAADDLVDGSADTQFTDNLPAGKNTEREQHMAELLLASAERELLRAEDILAERRLLGFVMIAEKEMRSAADGARIAARELVDAQHATEALALAVQARAYARRLQRFDSAVRPEQADAHERADGIIASLVSEGMLGASAREAASSWAHQAIEEARAAAL